MRTSFTVLLISLCVGCGEQPKFVHRTEFEDLAPYAQDYVNQVLQSHFGEPTDMVVWDRLPLKEHTATATVVIDDIPSDEAVKEEEEAAGTPETSITGPVSIRQLSLDLKSQNRDIAEGTELLWLNGPLEGSPSSWVTEWDAETQTVRLETPLHDAPNNGDQVFLGPGEVLVQGRLLYAEHCQHCHGVTGDGNGSTAPYLNPKPRDYRLGVFKFTTTKRENRAAREDLSRVIEDGIPGTYMPSFKLLTQEEMTSIVEYVLWLSMRGELEYQLISLIADEGYSIKAIRERVADGETYQSIREEFIERVDNPDEFNYEVDSIVGRIVNDWESSQTEEALIHPISPRVPYTPESIARGRELYLNESLKCAQCHGEAGYGNGSQIYAVAKMKNGDDYPVPGLHDDWGNLIKPRNLHTGIYRGGRRPIDLYSRIYAGIKGTPMPPFATLVRRSDPDDPSSPLTDEDIWDLVNYIYSIPLDGYLPGQDPGASASESEGVAVHSFE